MLQDVLNVLGEPAGILFKGAGAGLTGQDYFFNYMQVRLDVHTIRYLLRAHSETTCAVRDGFAV